MIRVPEFHFGSIQRDSFVVEKGLETLLKSRSRTKQTHEPEKVQADLLLKFTEILITLSPSFSVKFSIDTS